MNGLDGAVQIEQRIPRCGRCGKMINLRGDFLAIDSAQDDRILFCTELCRDEYVELFGIGESGTEGR